MKREEYLDILTEQIRCKKARGAVREELEAHMEDQKEAFMENGMKSEEAEERAVKEMGDPVETGISMDRIHRPKMAWGSILFICFLSLGGLLIQYLLQKQFLDIIFLPGSFVRHLIYVIIGLGVMMLFCFVDYSRIGYRAREISIVLFILLFEAIGLFGKQVNGAKSWISLGGITIDVKMALFLFVPLYGAILFCYKGYGYKVIRKAILWMLPAIVLAMWCNSLVTALLLFLTFAVTFSIAVSRKWFQVSEKIVLSVLWILIMALPFLGYAMVELYGAAYQKLRLKTMIGLEQGSKYVSEYGSGYVLHYIAVYYGTFAAIIVAGCITFLFLYFLKISFRQKNQLGQLMGAGCSIVFVIQTGIYILSNIGILPGIVNCPFITYGGTGIFVTYILLGILLSIYRYQNVVSERRATSRLFTADKV